MDRQIDSKRVLFFMKTFCRCQKFTRISFFYWSIAEINGCFGRQNITYQNHVKRFIYFHGKNTLTRMVTSLTLLAVCWTRVQTLSLSLQHSRRHFLWISVSHSTQILLLLSCHFPKQVSCDFGKKQFWKCNASFVLITGVCTAYL